MCVFETYLYTRTYFIRSTQSTWTETLIVFSEYLIFIKMEISAFVVFDIKILKILKVSKY